MAIKDWEVFSDNKTVKTWIKKKDNHGSNPHLNGVNISILPALGEWANGKWKNKKDWNFEINNKVYFVSKETFKTKSAALKFAKNYMRKH
jgi:hypothetical protein